MDYKEYKKASKRHLYTCKTFKKNLAKEDLSEDQRQHLLFNLYYLCGYIIECSLNFAILKFIDFERIARDNNLIDENGNRDCKLLRSWHNYNHKASFSYHYKDEAKRPQIDKFAECYLYRPGHKFQKNAEFVSTLLPEKAKNIRGIGSKIGNDVKTLFEEWDVNYRYQTKSKILKTQDVFKFLDLAEEIFTKLDNIGL